MSFLGLSGKTFLVLGVANKKSVAWHVAKTLEEEGAKVVYSVRSQARLDSLKGLLDGKPTYLCDLEREEETVALAAAVALAAVVLVVGLDQVVVLVALVAVVPEVVADSSR